MSEEQTWLSALATEHLAQACRVAGVKVDGFRQLNQVPRLLLERQILSLLTKHRSLRSSVKLRSALGKTWRERYATLDGLLQAGLTSGAEEDRPSIERWGEWLVGLCRTFGRAPVQMGLQVTSPPWAEPELLDHLESYWPADVPLLPEPLNSPETDTVAPAVEEVEVEEVEEATTANRSDGRQERLRAKLKSLTQENQALQRARTSAEHRAAHYQAQVEQVRTELEALANRTDWPQPRMLVQRLIRGLMDARRQILDLELANAELRRDLGRSDPEPEAEPEAE